MIENLGLYMKQQKANKEAAVRKQAELEEQKRQAERLQSVREAKEYLDQLRLEITLLFGARALPHAGAHHRKLRRRFGLEILLPARFRAHHVRSLGDEQRRRSSRIRDRTGEEPDMVE